MQVLDEVGNGLRKGRYPDKELRLQGRPGPPQGLADQLEALTHGSPRDHARARTPPSRTRCSSLPSTSPATVLEDDRRAGHRRCPPRHGDARRAPRDALVRVPVAGLPRAGGGASASRACRAARSRPSARPTCSPAPTRSSRPSGCPMPTGSLPATSAPATCCRYRETDPYLEAGFEATGDEDVDQMAFFELGLGRPRVLSAEGREAAATRWYAGDERPDAPRSRPRRPPAARRAATSCRWPARCAPPSASAPTSGARPTDGSSRSTTGAVRTPRPTSTSPSRCSIGEPIVDEFAVDLGAGAPDRLRVAPTSPRQHRTRSSPPRTAPSSRHGHGRGQPADGHRPTDTRASGTEPADGIRPRALLAQAASLGVAAAAPQVDPADRAQARCRRRRPTATSRGRPRAGRARRG